MCYGIRRLDFTAVVLHGDHRTGTVGILPAGTANLDFLTIFRVFHTGHGNAVGLNSLRVLKSGRSRIIFCRLRSWFLFCLRLLLCFVLSSVVSLGLYRSFLSFRSLFYLRGISRSLILSCLISLRLLCRRFFSLWSFCRGLVLGGFFHLRLLRSLLLWSLFRFRGFGCRSFFAHGYRVSC